MKQRDREALEKYEQMREQHPLSGWCWACGRDESDQPGWWHGPWLPNERAHIASSPRKLDVRAVILLCSTCHKTSHGERFRLWVLPPLTLANMLHLKREFCTLDLAFLQSCSVRHLPEPCPLPEEYSREFAMRREEFSRPCVRIRAHERVVTAPVALTTSTLLAKGSSMAAAQPIHGLDPSQITAIPNDWRFIDLTGTTIYSWTVLAYGGRHNGDGLWHCRCQCGQIELLSGQRLRNGAVRQHCGCVVDPWDKSALTWEQLEASGIVDCPSHMKDIAGQVVNRLSVVGLIGRWDNKTWWRCDCACGKSATIEQYSIVHGKVMSCGCAKVDAGKKRFKHGRSIGKENMLMLGKWHAMIARCHNPRVKSYPDYGGRGILVCERWRKSVDAFIEDMGFPPTPQHSLDRYPDTNGNYEPGNVRWATRHQQQRNTRKTILVTIGGETKCLKDWCAHLGLLYGTVRSRVSSYGWDVYRALAAPVDHARNELSERSSLIRRGVLPVPEQHEGESDCDYLERIANQRKAERC